MDYLSTQFLVYLGRWLLSGVIMLLPLYMLIYFNCCKGKYQEYIHILILQIIGAFIFYPIDLYIFK